MSAQWHISHQGRQYGPYTGEKLAEFVTQGRLLRESMIWAEGMEQWVRADSVEGLFSAVPPPPATHVPGGTQRWQVPQSAGGASAPLMAPGLGLMRVRPGEDYPAVEVKPALFGVMAAMMGGGVALLMVSSYMISHIAGRSGTPGHPLLFVLLGAGALGVLFGALLHLITIRRAWKSLRFSDPGTTGTRAVGFLFIPVFGLYWLFRAHWGLAKDWNRITAQHPNLEGAPRINATLALWFCIGCFFVPLGFVLWFPFMAQVAAAVNAMAYRRVHQAGTFLIG